MYDAIIIGGGPSGVAAATRIAQLGGKVAIIEKDKVGGVCVNWGCMPTKAMLASAKVVKEGFHAETFGIKVKTSIDFKKVVAYRDAVIEKSREHAKQILESYGIEIIYGEGAMIDKNTVGKNGSTFQTKNIILSTGSEVTIPNTIQLSKKVLTSKELVQIKTLPKKLVIIGGGVIGLEFASMFHLLGSQVTIIEMADKLLPNEDKEISQAMQEHITKQGITLLLSTKVEQITNDVVVSSSGKIPYDVVLVATGRKPLLPILTLDRLKIQYTSKGVLVNEKMQTNVKNVYCVGDTTGKSILAHVGMQQGVVAANNIMGQKDEIQYCIPRCIYSFPEVACVGKTEKEVKNPKTAIIHFKDVAKAIIDDKQEGFVKIIMEKENIVGFQMMGPSVTELINEAALIVSANITTKQILSTIHPHPTLGEIVKFAVQKATGQFLEETKT
jgi:dihydrolipoamide dehydrogenase